MWGLPGRTGEGFGGAEKGSHDVSLPDPPHDDCRDVDDSCDEHCRYQTGESVIHSRAGREQVHKPVHGAFERLAEVHRP